MEEQLISFETAKSAKEKGFDVPVKYYYDFMGGLGSGFYDEKDKQKLTSWNLSKAELYSAPTQSLLQKWLREEYDIECDVGYNKQFKVWYWSVDKMLELKFKFLISDREDSTYEEALEEGLQKALKLIP